MQKENKWQDRFDEKSQTGTWKGGFLDGGGTFEDEYEVDFESIKDFIQQEIDLATKQAIEEERERFLGTLDADSCECDNCNRTRRYFENPKKELLRYKNKCEAEVKKAIEERDKEIVEKITKIKETVREQTGSFKYDNQYDDCINLITSGNYVKVGDRYYRLENCELKELTNK